MISNNAYYWMIIEAFSGGKEVVRYNFIQAWFNDGAYCSGLNWWKNAYSLKKKAFMNWLAELEGNECNDSARLALKELRPVLAALEFELKGFREEEEGF